MTGVSPESPQENGDSGRLGKISVHAPSAVGIFHSGLDVNKASGCSKRPDFSPTQPRRAKTRRSAGKAAAREELEAYPQTYVGDLNDASGFFQHPASQHEGFSAD